MTFYENYDAYCRKNGIDPCSADTAIKIGISRAAITGWKKKGTKPREDKFQGIADALGVNINVVAGWAKEHEQKEKPSDVSIEELTDRDIRLISWLRSLPEEKRLAILVALDAPEDVF